MQKYKLITLLFFAAALYGCNKDWRYAMENVDPKVIFYNTPDGWNETQTIRQDHGNSLVYLKKYDGDTLKLLFLTVHDDGRMLTNEYTKHFRSDEDSCVVVMNGRDTLYFYKVQGADKEFIVGEYQYKYYHGPLKGAEMDYFRLHEDSLRKVPGNNLPRLDR